MHRPNYHAKRSIIDPFTTTTTIRETTSRRKIPGKASVLSGSPDIVLLTMVWNDDISFLEQEQKDMLMVLTERLNSPSTAGPKSRISDTGHFLRISPQMSMKSFGWTARSERKAHSPPYNFLRSRSRILTHTENGHYGPLRRTPWAPHTESGVVDNPDVHFFNSLLDLGKVLYEKHSEENLPLPNVLDPHPNEITTPPRRGRFSEY